MPIFPALTILTPATIADARGMLGAALLEPDPVLIFENQTLYNMEGEFPAQPSRLKFSRTDPPSRNQHHNPDLWCRVT